MTLHMSFTVSMWRITAVWNINPCLVLPLSYIEFYERGDEFVQAVVYKPYGFEHGGAKGFLYGGRQRGEERVFSDIIGIEPERAKAIFIDLFLYSHGIAVLAAAQK